MLCWTDFWCHCYIRRVEGNDEIFCNFTPDWESAGESDYIIASVKWESGFWRYTAVFLPPPPLLSWCGNKGGIAVFRAYLRDRVHGHQPGDETLVPGDVGQHGCVAVADGDSPGHTRVEVVVHADRQTGRFGCRAGEGDRLCGVAVPGVADTIRVTDGLDPTLSQFW